MEHSEILSSLILHFLPGLSRTQTIALLRHYGTASEALADKCSESQRWAELLKCTSGLSRARERALREWEFCEKNYVRVIPFGSEDYPLLLQGDEVVDAPACLFGCGDFPFPRRHVISVVGTRRITEYGKHVCDRLITDLARLVPDVCIVSGLAYGVDIHAHRAALDAGVKTYAVLAHGLDRIYPAMHKDTANQMIRQGGLLTEYASGSVPDKGHFICRNRIVASISEATLVVESAHHGGALVTANLASGYGREVMAVPGRISDAYSEGCNRLLQAKVAVPITSAEDIVKELCWTVQSARQPQQEPQLFTVYTVEQEKVLDAMQGEDSLSLDALSGRTGFTSVRLADLLFDLEEMGEVCRVTGNLYRLK